MSKYFDNDCNEDSENDLIAAVLNGNNKVDGMSSSDEDTGDSSKENSVTPTKKARTGSLDLGFGYLAS
jgi:hypothetical protein